jgi:hypothetical protein
MFKLTNNKLSNHSLKIRLIKLSLFSTPLSAAYFYSYTNYNSPFNCPILAFTGIPCPGCGLTRSFLALTKGNLISSFNYHLFGPILFCLLMLATIHLLLEIVTKQKIKAYYVKIIKNKTVQILTIPSILIYYLGRLLIMYFKGDLGADFKLSTLANLMYN